MEGDEVSQALAALPDELLERIIARMPFPSIFKARALSKSWLARFSPISSLDDEAQKGRAISFQNAVRETCNTWETFSPVSIERENSVAYNSVSASWQRVPGLCYLPWKSCALQIKGALSLTCHYPDIKGELKRCRGPPDPEWVPGWMDEEMISEIHILNRSQELYVANILTGSWKLLPPRPNADTGVVFTETLLTNVSSETYTVIVFCLDHDHRGICGGYSAQIYDSKTASWSSKQLGTLRHPIYVLSTPAFFNGVLYMILDYMMEYVMAYDVEAGTWKMLNLSFNGQIEEATGVSLLVCNSNLMMIAENAGLDVMKVELVSNQLLRVGSGPPKAILEGKFKAAECFVGVGNCIYFGRVKSDGSMVAYDLHQNKWIFFDPPPIDPETAMIDLKVPESSSNGEGKRKRRGEKKNKMKHYDWCLSPFQPGLNPFMEV